MSDETLREKVVKELGYSMDVPNLTDIALFATWISRRKDGSLTATALELKTETLTDEVKEHLAMNLLNLADIIKRDTSRFKVIQAEKGE